MLYVKLTFLFIVLICASSHMLSLINVEDTPSVDQGTKKKLREYKKFLEQEKQERELCKPESL